MEIEKRPLISNNLKDKLRFADSLELSLQSSCYIYRVPPQLRKVNEAAYTPSVVSIGPYHYGDKRLESMQEFKFWHFKNFLKRTREKSLESLFKVVKDWNDEIRCCYSENIQMETDDFVSMILIDACFIIEFFLAIIDPSSEDPWITKPRLTAYIMLDLILLENQLPFFVLERLFDLTFPNGMNDEFSLLEVAFHNFASSFLQHMYSSNSQIENFRFEYFSEFHLTLCNGETPQVHHLCDLLRTFYVPNDSPPRAFGIGMKRSYGVSQLKERGITFRVLYSKKIIELRCSKGVLKIPGIKITGWTEIMLRNVVAFEQCHLPFMHYMTDYIILLDCLINTEKDVEILVEKGIIENTCDNDKVASMVNKLSDNVTVTSISCDYFSLHAKLKEFYHHPYYKNKASFVREYWSTPWKIVSLFGGILLLLLTLVQTVCSLIPIIKK